MADPWEEGECDKCNRETRLLTIEHEEFDTVCLVCGDGLVEDGDLSTIAAGGTR